MGKSPLPRQYRRRDHPDRHQNLIILDHFLLKIDKILDLFLVNYLIHS